MLTGASVLHVRSFASTVQGGFTETFGLEKLTVPSEKRSLRRANHLSCSYAFYREHVPAENPYSVDPDNALFTLRRPVQISPPNSGRFRHDSSAYEITGWSTKQASGR
jgi:hypothetical protein